MYYYFARWSKPGGQCLVLVSKRKDSYGTSFADDARLDAELSLIQYHCNVSPLGWETKNIFSLSVAVAATSRTVDFLCLLPPANEVWGKVMFSQACVSHSVRGGSLYDVTSCLAAWCHAPFARVSVSGPMFFPEGVSVCGPTFLLGRVSVQGGSPWTENPTPLDRDPPDRDP